MVISHRRFDELPWSCDPWQWFATTSAGAVVPLALSPGMKVNAIMRSGVVVVLVPPDLDVRGSKQYLFILNARSPAWRVHALEVPRCMNDFDLTSACDTLAIATGWGKDTEFAGTQYGDCNVHLIDTATSAPRKIVTIEAAIPSSLEGEEDSFLVLTEDVDRKQSILRCHAGGELGLFADYWHPHCLPMARGRVQVVEGGPHERWVHLASGAHTCAIPRTGRRVSQEAYGPGPGIRVVEGACAAVEADASGARLLAPGGELIRSFCCPGSATLAFSVSGRWLAVASDASIEILDSRSGACQATWVTRVTQARSPASGPSNVLNVDHGARAVAWVGDDYVVCIYGTAMIVGSIATKAVTVWHGDLTWVDEASLSDQSWHLDLRGASHLRVPIISLLEAPCAHQDVVRAEPERRS